MYLSSRAARRPLNHFLKRTLWPLASVGLLGATMACQGQTTAPNGAGNATASHLQESTPQRVTMTAKQDTLLKRDNIDSAQQNAQQLCSIPEQSTLEGAVQPAQDGHLKFYLKTGESIANCRFTVGFIFADHFDIQYLEGGNSSGQPRATMAMLAVIAHAEGTDERYDLIFGFRTFSNFGDHPRLLVCSGGYCSTAAGRYQFLETTWDETRLAANLKDFSPGAQDRGAIYRMESFRGMREHGQTLSRSQFERAIYKINREWASLPGSPYGQPTKPMSTLWSVYQQNL